MTAAKPQQNRECFSPKGNWVVCPILLINTSNGPELWKECLEGKHSGLKMKNSAIKIMRGSTIYLKGF